MELKTQHHKTVLSNGIRVVTETHPSSRAVSAGIWVCSGSRDEKREHQGLAHFLEHLVFKGTQKRSAYQLAKVMESRGGDLNAFTSKESICFHALALAKDIDLVFDVLSDLAFRATIPAKEYTLERRVVQQEIAMYYDDHEEYLFDTFVEKSYKKHPMGWPILGCHETLESISRKDVLKFYKEMFVGENLIVGVASPYPHDVVLKKLRPYLEKVSAKAPKLNRRRPRYHSFSDHIQRDIEQSHLLMGFEAPHLRDPLRFASYIVNAALGEGMTSLLYQDIREKRGLAYSVYSLVSNTVDSGLSLIYAGTEPEKMEQTQELIFENLKKIKKKYFNSSLMERFKTQITGYMILNEDDLESRMMTMCMNEMIFKKYRSSEDAIRSIQETTLRDVQEYISEYIDLNKVSTLTLGTKA